jgi:hypothetical protein
MATARGIVKYRRLTRRPTGSTRLNFRRLSSYLDFKLTETAATGLNSTVDRATLEGDPSDPPAMSSYGLYTSKQT